jgi:hypothetical protein
MVPNRFSQARGRSPRLPAAGRRQLSFASLIDVSLQRLGAAEPPTPPENVLLPLDVDNAGRPERQCRTALQPLEPAPRHGTERADAK